MARSNISIPPSDSASDAHDIAAASAETQCIGSEWMQTVRYQVASVTGRYLSYCELKKGRKIGNM